MSNTALTWAWASPLTGGPKFVLVALADKGGEHDGDADWTCYPSIELLASMTGMDRRTVERHLSKLEADGWITRRRRRRADGTLGIYDFFLHRTPRVRASAPASGPVDDAPRQPTDCRVDQTTNGAATTRQNGPQPHDKSPEQEPSGEPSGEPTTGARAGEASPGGSDGGSAGGAVDGTPALAEPEPARAVDRVLARWPQSGLARTAARKVEPGWAAACDRHPGGEAGLEACALRYLAEDRDLKRGDHGAPGLHTWLADDRWKAWLPVGQATPSDAARRVAATAVFPDAELRAAVAASADEAFARSYLDPAGWDAERKVLTPRTGAARERLQARVGRLLSGRGVTLAAAGVRTAESVG